MLYKSQFYFRPCVGRICQSLAYENPAEDGKNPCVVWSLVKQVQKQHQGTTLLISFLQGEMSYSYTFFTEIWFALQMENHSFAGQYSNASLGFLSLSFIYRLILNTSPPFLHLKHSFLSPTQRFAIFFFNFKPCLLSFFHFQTVESPVHFSLHVSCTDSPQDSSAHIYIFWLSKWDILL